MVDLVSLNLTLDAALKLVLLLIFVLAAVVLYRVDKAIKSADRSIESIGDVAEKFGEMMTLRKIYKLIKRGKK